MTPMRSGLVMLALVAGLGVAACVAVFLGVRLLHS